MKKHLIISTSVEMIRIAPGSIAYINAEGNYSMLYQADNETRLLPYQLGKIEEMIASQFGCDANNFIRVGKSFIINRSYIYHINLSQQKLVVSDAKSFRYTLKASKDALKKLKELMEGKEVNS